MKVKWPVIDCNGTAYDEDDFVKAFRKVVRKAVSKALGSQRANPPLVEDLIQVSWVSVLRNLPKYDPQLGHTMAAYVYKMAWGGALHYLRDHHAIVRPTRSITEARGRIYRYTEDVTLSELYSRADEIAKEVGVSAESIRQATVHIASPILYLDAPVTDGKGEEGDMDRYDMFVASVVDEEQEERLAAALYAFNAMEGRDKEIIAAFLGGMKQSEVAAMMGCSQMHISRLQRRALDRMREIANRQLEL